MKLVYKDNGDTLGGYKCLSLYKGSDKVLSGIRGEIWLDEGKGQYKAFVVVNRKYEKIFSFDYKDLEKYKKRLGVPLDLDEQAKWANNPNLRLD